MKEKQNQLASSRPRFVSLSVSVCVRARVVWFPRKKNKFWLVFFLRKRKKNPFFPAFSRPPLPRPLPLSRKRQQKKDKKPTNPTATLDRPWVSPVSVKVSLRGVGWRHYRGFVHIYIYINVYISTRKKNSKNKRSTHETKQLKGSTAGREFMFLFFLSGLFLVFARYLFHSNIFFL